MVLALWRLETGMGARGVAAGLSLVLLAAACESSSPKTGTIDGRAGGCIAPGYGPRTITVVVERAGKEVARQDVRRPYVFRFSVKPGGYVVRTLGLGYEEDASVHVRSGRRARAAMAVKIAC